MPRICSFYNPSLLDILSLSILFLLLSELYVRYISFWQILFELLERRTLSRHPQILFTWRSLNYYTIQHIFYSFHIMRICKCNDNSRQWNTMLVCLSVRHTSFLSYLCLQGVDQPIMSPLKALLQIRCQAIAIPIQCIQGYHKPLISWSIIFEIF